MGITVLHTNLTSESGASAPPEIPHLENEQRFQASAGEVTRLLDALSRDETQAAERLLRLVYHELHRVARAHMRGEDPQNTLQATALVSEAYLRMMGSPAARWENRAHFFASAAEVMRRILVDAARKRRAAKRGGERIRVTDGDLANQEERDPELVVAVNEALDRLVVEDPQLATIVKLRFFSGLSAPETAAALGISLRTVEREWRFAKARLQTWLSGDISGGESTLGALE